MVSIYKKKVIYYIYLFIVVNYNKIYIYIYIAKDALEAMKEMAMQKNKQTKNQQILNQLVDRSEKIYEEIKKHMKDENINKNNNNNKNNNYDDDDDNDDDDDLKKNEIAITSNSNQLDNNYNYDDYQNKNQLEELEYLSYDEERIYNLIEEIQPTDKNGVSETNCNAFTKILLSSFHRMESKKHVIKMVKFMDRKNIDLKYKMKIMQQDLLSLESTINHKNNQ